jgi:hypothetical protein
VLCQISQQIKKATHFSAAFNLKENFGVSDKTMETYDPIVTSIAHSFGQYRQRSNDASGQK